MWNPAKLVKRAVNERGDTHDGWEPSLDGLHHEARLGQVEGAGATEELPEECEVDMIEGRPGVGGRARDLGELRCHGGGAESRGNAGGFKVRPNFMVPRLNRSAQPGNSGKLRP